jgi:hypothetical protein
MYVAELDKTESLGTIEVSKLSVDSYISTVGKVHIFAKPTQFQSRKTPEECEDGLWVEAVQDTTGPEANRVMWMQLTKEINETYAVSMVRVDPKFQGYGVAPKLYASLIKNSNISLVTDQGQTEGGQYIWNTLVQDKGIQIAAYNSKLIRAPRTLHPVRQGVHESRLEVVGYNAWSHVEGANNWGFVMSKSPKQRRKAA